MKTFKPVSKKPVNSVFQKEKVKLESPLPKPKTEVERELSLPPLSSYEENTALPNRNEEKLTLPFEGLRCACGEPVAPGQHQVCAKHIRTN